MAAPNIVNITSIVGNTATLNVNTIAANIIVNAAGSNQVYKVNTVTIANIDNANTYNATVSLLRGGINNFIAANVAIPYNATLVLVSKDTSMYVAEGDAISVRGGPNSNGKLWAISSYEVLS
jgi:hypothetical protein